jgi:hypothetical protein
MLASIEMNMRESTLICIWIYRLRVKWFHSICVFQEESVTNKKAESSKLTFSLKIFVIWFTQWYMLSTARTSFERLLWRRFGVLGELQLWSAFESRIVEIILELLYMHGDWELPWDIKRKKYIISPKRDSWAYMIILNYHIHVSVVDAKCDVTLST